VVVNRNQNGRRNLDPCTMGTHLRYQFDGPNITFTHTLGEEGEYRLLLLNCDNVPRYSVESKTLWTLRDGTYLSRTQSMMPAVYLSLMLLWLFAVLLWLLQCLAVQLRLQPLHWLLSACAVAKTAQLTLSMVAYRELQLTDERDTVLTYAAELCEVVAETLLLSVCFLQAMGWGVIRRRLNGREKQLFGGAFGLSLVFSMLYALCSGPAALCSAYMLSYRTIKLLVLLGVFMAHSSNVDRLRMDLLDRTVDYHRRYIVPKIDAYRQLMPVLLVYLLVPVVGMVVSVSLFDWTQSWLQLSVDELVYLFVVAAIAFIFRPCARNDERLFTYFGMDNLPFEAGLGEGHAHHGAFGAGGGGGGGGGAGHVLGFGAPGFGAHQVDESSSSEEEEEVLQDDAIEEGAFSDDAFSDASEVVLL
jgi:GOST, seven transmembrane domain